MNDQENATALAADLNSLFGKRYRSLSAYDRALARRLRRHRIDPNVDQTQDIRQVGGEWWVRFDPRLGKWRAVESQNRPPLIAFRYPQITQAFEDAKRQGLRIVGIGIGDEIVPVRTVDNAEAEYEVGVTAPYPETSHGVAGDQDESSG